MGYIASMYNSGVGALQSAQTLVSGETKEKEECTRSSKPAALTSLKALLVMGD